MRAVIYRPTPTPPTPWELLVGHHAAGEVSSDVDTPERAFALFVQASLEEHAATSLGCELHARVATFSQLADDDPWIATGAELPAEVRDLVVDACRGVETPRGFWPLDERWRVAARHVGGAIVPGGRASLGMVIGAYPRSVADAFIGAHLAKVSHDLRVGAGLCRRLGDAAALSKLTSTLARAGHRARALEEMGAVLRERTRSSHAKVYVARWHAGERQIQRMLRTDKAEAPKTYPLRDDLGFADRVFRTGQWLLISEVTRGDDVPDRGLAQRDGVIEVLGRPSRMLDPGDVTGDGERALLLVPMRADDQVLGVLSVWRDVADPYDPELDTQSLESMVPAVLSACRWRVEADANQHRARCVRELEDVLRSGPPPGALYRALVQCAVTLGSASAGALYISHNERPGVLYPAAFETGDPSDGVADSLTQALRVGERDSGEVLASHLLGCLNPDCAELRALERLAIPGGEATLALLDRHEDGDRHTLDEGTLSATIRAFFEQAGAVVFDRGESALIHHAMQRAADVLTDADAVEHPVDAEAVIARAARATARLVYEHTTCDAALIYRRDVGGLVVVGACAEAAGLLGRASSAHAAEVVATGQPVYVLDAGATDGDAAALKSLAEALGWRGVRSWVVIPVIVNERPVGALKLLTRAGGRCIDRASFKIAEAIMTRVARELLRWTRYQRLSTLNDMASELAAIEQRSFEREVAPRLDAWVQRYIDPSAHVLMIASIDGVRLKVFSNCAHVQGEVFQRENDAWLQALLDGWRRDPAHTPDVRGLKLGALRGASTDTPVRFERVPLPYGRGLAAWLLVFSERRFTREDVAATREAARELTIFLDHERQRYLWSMELARYRHAVIGPTQGLASAARMLHRLARDGGDPAAIARFGRLVEREATSIRLWRDNQRLYAGGSVNIAPRRTELRPTVDACVARFRDVLRERDIELKVRWLCPAGFAFEFDADALDLVLSNLVDNARKYAFFHTEVTIEVRLAEGHMVHISVEDVGHDIPERIRDAIYRVGQRLDWNDPIRAIEGTGLGLPMARALVERHGGTLTHECHALGVSNGVSRSVVRFLVSLPRRAIG